MQFVLPLNETQLVFLSADATGLTEPHVVQTTIKSDRPQNVDTLCAYMLDQRDISEMVVKLVIAHMNTPLPPLFVVDGHRYTITAARKKWKYGENLQILWGETTVKSCPDKWTFTFTPLDQVEQNA